MWAGQYAINGYDGIPVVADYPGLIYVGAASGSGIMKCDALGRIVGATHAGMEHAELYNGVKFRCSVLGIHKRNVDREEFII
jgi:glycine/D-amino acid oxidase-like deaminating enzyme